MFNLTAKLSLLIFLFLSGCSTAPKYYDKIVQNEVDTTEAGSDSNLIPEGEVHIGLYITEPSTPSTTRTIFELEGEGQAELIKKLNGSNAQIMAALAAPIRSSSSTPNIDRRRTSFRRTLIFTIGADGIPPADRLEEVYIQSTLDNDKWEIDSWSNYEHRTRNITLAQIQNTIANQLSGEAGGGFPLTDIIGLSGSSTLTTQSTQNLISEVISYSPRPDDQEISLALKSVTPQVNIAGTYAITVTIVSKQEEIKTVPVFRFNTTSGSESVQRNSLEFVKSANNPIKLNTIMPFKFRHVKNNQNTIEEGDDTVIYYNTIDGFNKNEDNVDYTKTTEKTLIRENQIRQDVYIARILDSSNPSHPKVKLVKIFDPALHPLQSKAQCIASQDVGNLRSFLNWVNLDVSERTAFQKDGILVYKLVDENGNDIRLGTNEKLITTLSRMNYSSNDSAHEVPDQCSNLK